MLPADHFLSLAVGEALKPCQDWEVFPPNSSTFMPDFFGVDNDSSAVEDPDTKNTADKQASRSKSASVFKRQQIVVSSSIEGEGASQDKNGSTSKPETFGILLAQVHFILSILSKDDSYIRLPTSRNLHQCLLIGGGHSFIVRRASHQEIPELKGRSEPYFAIKTANITAERDATARMRDILREVQILTHESLRSHPNIVTLLGFGWEQLRVSTSSKIARWPYLLLEYAEYGSMVDLFEQHVVGFQTRFSLCQDIGMGLEALHAADIVHGDIKLENVLVYPSISGRVTGKVTDFGFAEVDLDGSQPAVGFRRGTLPWKAPEADGVLARSELALTDVYSFGFLIWRTIAYGHRPFVEAGGSVPQQVFEKLEEQKVFDGGILSMALECIKLITPVSDRFRIIEALECCLQRQSKSRKLKAAVTALGGAYDVTNIKKLRIRQIPQHHGLGIYRYGCFDKRLDRQMMVALNSFCDSRHSVEGPLAAFRAHCASTLSGCLAWSHMCISACSGSNASVEALYSLFYLLWPEGRTIPIGVYALLAGRALRQGMEFILREIMEDDIPGKEKFLEVFTTRLCRGSNLTVGSPDSDNPLPSEDTMFGYVKDGVLTPEAIFRMVITWGQLSVARNIHGRFELNVNAQDGNGETALLRACRAGHYDIASWLLTDLKANPKLSTKLGITPLHWIHIFPPDQALKLAKLLRKRAADPNAIAVNNGTCNIEAEYWFFKGPPLIRAVAAGNEAAVRALLAIGANPLIPIRPGDENSIEFAARRQRARILKVLLDDVPAYQVWKINDNSGNNLLAIVIGCCVSYAAKIHGRNHGKARIDTFDLLWNWENRRNSLFPRSRGQNTAQRMLRSITSLGKPAVQEAVYKSDMIIVKHLMKIISDAPDCDHRFVKRMTDIGLQAAVMYERRTMVEYFLSAGADPLQRPFYVQPGKECQRLPQTFENLSIPLCEKNTLHFCARAGVSANTIGRHIINNLKPKFVERFSEEEQALRSKCAIELTYSLHLPGGVDDPLLDKRDESDNTPFFLALQNEEYEFARLLRSAGADKNALIRDTPIVEHLLTWSPPTARIALEFLVRGTWGNLRLSRHPRRHYLDLAIAASKNWPSAQAADFISDVYGYVAPRHDHEVQIYRNHYTIAREDGGPVECGCKLDWDAHISKAVEGLQPHAVAELVSRRPETPPNDSFSPINALRRTIFGLKVPETLKERKEVFQAWRRAAEILPILQHRYPDHRFDIGMLLRGIAGRIAKHIGPELAISFARFCAGALSAKGLSLQVTRLLTPFLGVAAGCQMQEVDRLLDFIQEHVPTDYIRVTLKKHEREIEGLELVMDCINEDTRIEWNQVGFIKDMDLSCEIFD